MILRKWGPSLLLALGLFGATALHAATYSEVVNGATCIGYPPYQNTTAVPYQHWLYGFSNRAFCHITMSSEWTVQNLSYVLFTGAVPSGTMKVRVCVHGGTLSVTCGPEVTISGSGTVNWAPPPSPLPKYATGAFLDVAFPGPLGVVSTLNQYIPVWSK